SSPSEASAAGPGTCSRPSTPSDQRHARYAPTPRVATENTPVTWLASESLAPPIFAIGKIVIHADAAPRLAPTSTHAMRARDGCSRGATTAPTTSPADPPRNAFNAYARGSGGSIVTPRSSPDANP